MSRDETTTSPSDGGKSTERVRAIWAALNTVTDPEIPVLSVVDMGIIAGVQETDAGVIVDITPTFAACPATALIREQVRDAVAAATGAKVTVNIVFDPPWTSERMSPEGREKLTAFGVAPPGSGAMQTTQTPELRHVACPFCGSHETDVESIFGPTLCRSIHYCRSCRQSFEHFKPVE